MAFGWSLTPTIRLDVGSMSVGSVPSGPIPIGTCPSSSEAATGAMKNE